MHKTLRIGYTRRGDIAYAVVLLAVIVVNIYLIGDAYNREQYEWFAVFSVMQFIMGWLFGRVVVIIATSRYQQ